MTAQEILSALASDHELLLNVIDAWDNGMWAEWDTSLGSWLREGDGTAAVELAIAARTAAAVLDTMEEVPS